MDIDFSPEKSLFSLPVVRLCAGLSAAIAILISLVILYNSRYYPFDLSGSGFNRFAEFHKVPIAILAIGFTLVGLCAANHRSEQTKKQIERTLSQIELTYSQIEITKGQNTFSNYYKHIEEFDKYCSAHNNETTEFEKPRILHKAIFNKANSSSTEYIISQQFIENIDSFLNKIIEISDALRSTDSPTRIKAGISISQHRNEFTDKYNIKIISKKESFKLNSGDEILSLPDSSWKEFFNELIKIAKGLDDILSFDVSYISSETLKKFLNINLDQIPGPGQPNSLVKIEYRR